MDLNKDYYKILGVTKTSSSNDIKNAYKKLVKMYHPDLNKNNSDDKIKEINIAYSVLSDETTKKQYDTQSPYGKSYNPNPFEHVGGIYEIFNVFFGNDLFSQSRNPFGSFFHGGKNEYKEFHENLDITINLIVTLNDVYKGKPIKVSYKRFVHCETCKGTGFDPKSESYECEICGGIGKDNLGRKCEYCQGVGKIYSMPCGFCNGEKIVLRDAEFNITNVENIRASEDKYLRSFGHQSKYFREKKGDLKLKIIYQEVNKYKIIDNKLYYNLDLHYEDAIKGFKYEYKLLDDSKIKVSIPEKTKDGDIIRLKGKGLILDIKGNRDDLYIKINIIIDYKRLQKNLEVKFNI
ncbi:MAG: DnaJ domain-containing protein [Ignavibacteria bacterium]|nr:DnaJ domain-containing protein [Ignavibacteria bacterium]